MVCKTIIPRFKSGWLLEETPANGGVFRFYFAAFFAAAAVFAAS